ncbi:MAG: ATP-dependent RecD-like DNA helicase [Symploca sp. SIO1B1]|nr:ATP-dependent RecD-like DNA helicase [Symploca sp. SIO1B1]
MLAQQSQQTEKLCGSICRITFKAEDSGYAVLKIQTPEFEVVTAVGIIPDAQPGLDIELNGEWVRHPKWGQQFKVLSYHMPEPTQEEGMVAFLSCLDGLGESKAQKIVEYFGENTFRVFSEDSTRLLEIPGIGKKTLPKILESFQEKKELSRLIGFLHELGVSASYAKRIYEEYGDNAIGCIKANPYLLAEEVRGFGFKRADEVARGLGIGVDASVRITAAIFHNLKEAANRNGHCFLPLNALLVSTKASLTLPDYQPCEQEIVQQVSTLSIKEVLVEENGRIYLRSYHQAELELSATLRSLCGKLELECEDLEDWLIDYEIENEIQLATQQREAVKLAASNNLMVITGGAGVGKSTISKAILSYWHSLKKRVVAVAPTGKAAQRIREVADFPDASTIHRLLGWTGYSFLHDKDNPLDADAFLIDEGSMIDLKLAYALFDAIPPHATVVIVGDVNQLPSVGAGNVLRDIIDSEEIPVVRLTEIFRQIAKSKIIQASQAINEGYFPSLEKLGRDSEPKTDALWIPCSQGQIPEAIEWLVNDKLLNMGYEEDDIQCLSPMHKGDVGNIELNKLIQQAWNPKYPIQSNCGIFREGDRVIQTRNDYNKLVFNGDIGNIVEIDKEENIALICYPDFDGNERLIEYQLSDLKDVMLAYSISVHRSQGSEFPVVILPVSMQQYMMLQRNLYYTGVTRGKKLVVIVGEEKPLQIAVQTNRVLNRNTTLRERLAGNL